MTLRVKSLSALCAVAALIISGMFVVAAQADVGAKTQRPPSAKTAAKKAPKAMREQLKALQQKHHVAKGMSAAQQRVATMNARAMFAQAHPELAKSAAVRAAKAASSSSAYYAFTSWVHTGYDSAWQGLEWYTDGAGIWVGYTVTWDPSFGTRYGNQYLYYDSGTYYGFWYWR